MRIRWENIIPLILIVLFIVLIVKLGPFFHHLFEGLNEDYSYHDPSDRIFKMGVIGLICLTIVGVVKLTTRK